MPADPNATTFPSGRRSTSRASELSPNPGVETTPPVPKPPSSVPDSPYRATRKAEPSGPMPVTEVGSQTGAEDELA